MTCVPHTQLRDGAMTDCVASCWSSTAAAPGQPLERHDRRQLYMGLGISVRLIQLIATGRPSAPGYPDEVVTAKVAFVASVESLVDLQACTSCLIDVHLSSTGLHGSTCLPPRNRETSHLRQIPRVTHLLMDIYTLRAADMHPEMRTFRRSYHPT